MEGAYQVSENGVFFIPAPTWGGEWEVLCQLGAFSTKHHFWAPISLNSGPFEVIQNSGGVLCTHWNNLAQCWDPFTARNPPDENGGFIQ